MSFLIKVAFILVSSSKIVTVQPNVSWGTNSHWLSLYSRTGPNWKYLPRLMSHTAVIISRQNWNGFFSNANELQQFLDKKPTPWENKNLALKLGIQTYQILTYDDEVCIPSLSSILLAVCLV